MPAPLFTAGSVVVLLGGLIFVHELGHFLVAKALGVKVLRFSIGFGPRLLGFRRGETEYWIAALPLGGYVKMAGDDPSEAMAPEDAGRGFLEQAPWKRLAIAIAGPGANLLFPALVFFTLALAHQGNPTPGPFLGTVMPGSPADVGGLRPGDRILSVAVPGQPPEAVRYFSDLRDFVSPHPAEPLVFRVARDGSEIAPVTIVPKAEEDQNAVETTRRGVLGVSASYPTAVVAPARPGAAGPVEPFDLVVAVDGKPVRHLGELSGALARAACAPIDLEVVRERPIDLPAATLATFDTLKLSRVPTCADGKATLLPADSTVSTFVAAVVPGSPADRAGLRRGDAIETVNGSRVRSFRYDFQALSRELKPGVPVTLGLAGGRTVQLVPETEKYVEDTTKEVKERLVVGFLPDRRNVDARALLVEEVPLQRGLVEMATMAVRDLGEMVRLTVLGIVRIATRKISFKTVGGPLMLIGIASEAAEGGLSVFLTTMALISVNLALMNLLPIPVLDGGHIAQAVLEGVTRRPISPRTRQIANYVGLALLITLMVFVFKNDIARMMG